MAIHPTTYPPGIFALLTAPHAIQFQWKQPHINLMCTIRIRQISPFDFEISLDLENVTQETSACAAAILRYGHPVIIGCYTTDLVMEEPYVYLNIAPYLTAQQLAAFDTYVTNAPLCTLRTDSSGIHCMSEYATISLGPLAD